MSTPKINASPVEIAYFRFGVIAPVIQGTFPDASEAAFYRRVAREELTLPDGSHRKYSPDTFEKWTSLYRKEGMDGLLPKSRSDKGVSRTIDDDDTTRAQALIDLLNDHRITVKIPCLLAYDESSVYGECTRLYERVQAEVERIKDYFNRHTYSFVGFSPEMVFCVFPIENTDRLRDKENGFYAGLC